MPLVLYKEPFTVLSVWLYQIVLAGKYNYMAYIQDCWPTRTSQQVLILIIAYNFVFILVERQCSERIFHIKIIFYYLPVLKKVS